MKDKWTMEMDQKGLYNEGKTSIRGGSKNITRKDWRRFTVALERTYHLKLPIHSKTYSSNVNSTSDYMCIPPWTGFEPWLTIRKPIISPIFSPTLLQIYCIKLIGPISYSFWVWATVGDLTISAVCGKKISASKVYNGYGGFRTTPDQSTPCRIS